jgi:hypothetical protein
MVMTDLYLSFPDEAAANKVLYGAEDMPNFANIDTLGILYERQEIIDPDNPPEPIPIPGWHINIRLVEGEDSEPLLAYEVHPTVPRRVWA